MIAQEEENVTKENAFVMKALLEKIVNHEYAPPIVQTMVSVLKEFACVNQDLQENFVRK